MRWLLVKDLQILRRSPLLVGLLVVYPVVIALMIGFALSSPPGKPTVALYDAVPTGRGAVSLGNQKINIAHYTNQLFQSITPIRVNSRGEEDSLFGPSLAGSDTMNQFAPAKRIHSFHPPQRTLMGPGPSEINPRVMAAMSLPAIGYLDPIFVEMMQKLLGLVSMQERIAEHL